MAETRLQKLMAQAGYGSRRACEKIISQGRVTVNGKLATLGQQADPDRDVILVDGQQLELPEQYTYIMLNKPPGVISDVDVAGNYPSARDLIAVEGHLYPTGRLDVDSEGLLLFTNDGELANRLMHPRYEHTKTYHVWVSNRPSKKTLERWRQGIHLDGRRTAPAQVTILDSKRNATQLEIVLTEGRKRIIRRVADQLGHPVQQLKRVKLGPIELGDLPGGAWRRLTREELSALRKIRR